MRRLGILLAGLAVLLVLVAPASGRKDSTFVYSFEGYANNVRVRAPLVGPWQLGVARIRGSGTAGQTVITGSFYDTDDPRLSRYEPRWLRAKVVFWNYKYFGLPHGGGTRTTLTLKVEITSSSHPNDECAPGLTGKLVLFDSALRLDNGESEDYITLGHWSGKCNTHIHGWTNNDGGARTEPARGGPGGGQWAFVKVTKRD